MAGQFYLQGWLSLVVCLILSSLAFTNGQQCHCAPGVQCDSDFRCSGNCAEGWDGQFCRRQNVALGKATSQSSDYCEGPTCYTSGYGVDGITGHRLSTPCTHTRGSTPGYWEVDLGATYRVNRFKIYNRGNVVSCGPTKCGARLNGFTLSVGGQVCYQDRTTDPKGPGDIIDGTCNQGRPVSGNTVRISVTGGFSLCEVLIYVCSTGWYGEMCENRCVTTTSCASCDVTGSRCEVCVVGRWGVDCGRNCGNCLDNNACDKGNGRCPPPASGEPRCAAGYKNPQCLTPCVKGEYGPDCLESCGNCAQGTAQCDTASGICQDRPNLARCKPGNSGLKCKTPCDDGKWGADCRHTCGQCYDQAVCNKSTGTCPIDVGVFRCAAGYNGTHCVTECTPGHYGPDCGQMCGSCRDGRDKCDGISGDCPADSSLSTCMAGYQSPKCQQGCPGGMWGADCKIPCGNCFNDAFCDAESGDCPIESGNPLCDPGYEGKGCDESCQSGFWGSNCSNECSVNCNGGCHHINGACGNGCLSGFTGELCSTAKKTTGGETNPKASTGGIIGGVIAAIVGVVVVVLGVLFYRRRYQASSKGENSKAIWTATTTDMDGHNNRGPSPGYEAEDVEAVEGGQEAILYENAFTEHTPVSTDEFLEYLKRKRAADAFATEFKKFPVGLHQKCEVAELPQNKVKSRYKNLVAYDHSRVVLKNLPPGSDSDYINACYINGYREPQKFIASQGPNDVIINDFVLMIWEQNVGKVVMVTNLQEDNRKKCNQYWPDVGAVNFGAVEITLLDEESYANYTIRTLRLTHAKVKKMPHVLKQFHFTAWPDHGAPSDATGLLDFRHRVLEYQSPLKGPIVVHCSAGIGRTGTFIALDYLIHQAEEEGRVDVPACVVGLRQQRVNMVQSQEQYEFLHEALAEALKLTKSSVPSVNFPGVYADLCTVDEITGKPKMAEEFKVLRELTPVSNNGNQKAAHLKENIPKNRNDKILALDNCRPYLSTPVKGCNDYINAVYLPGFKTKKRYILTQNPLPNTVVDFWRLVYDHGVSTIVTLDVIEASDMNNVVFWPSKSGSLFPFEVEVTDNDDHRVFSTSTYELTYKDTKAPKPIRHYRCSFWPNSPSVESIPQLLALLQNIELWQTEVGNPLVLVHCSDGVTKSGLFCAAFSVIDRLKTDGNVNILQSVKQMRVNRPEIVKNLAQYKLLHQIVISYLENFQTYANFN